MSLGTACRVVGKNFLGPKVEEITNYDDWSDFAKDGHFGHHLSKFSTDVKCVRRGI